ncbi:MAG: hypothetical protein WD114_00295 [Phycisphaerales bacterium]
MPAVSQPRTPCIAQLAGELGFASKPTLLRHLARIDALAPQIDPGGVYPEDWIVFRITAYRPDIADPALVPGEALRGDLSAIAESVSEAAGLTMEDIGEAYETIDSLASRWNVSRKTIERYRRLGLIARRIDLGGGRRRVVFLRPAVEWFEEIHAQRLGRAARFDRIGSAELDRIRRRARRYRDRLGWSRSRAAARIAAVTGHSHEGVRKALLRLDRGAESAIFPEPGPASTRERMLAYRALLRGIEPAAIAERSGRSVGSVHRAINSARMDLLMSYGLPASGLDAGVLAEALESEPVAGLGLAEGPRDLSELIGRMRRRGAVVVYEERMRALAAFMLARRAGEAAERMEREGVSGTLLDAAETDLRRVAALKVALLRAQQPLILSTIEHQLGGLIDTLAPARAAQLVLSGLWAASGAIDRYDPGRGGRGGRLAAPVGLAVTRLVSRMPDIAQPANEGKAMRRIPPGHAIADWTRQVSTWQRWLEPDPRIVAVLDRLDGRDRRVLSGRYGIGRSAATRAAMARVLGTSVAHTARFERAAVRRALAVARENGPA